MKHYSGILIFESDGRSIYPRVEFSPDSSQILDTSFLKTFFGNKCPVDFYISFNKKIIILKAKK